MPKTRFVLILASVILAAAVSVGVASYASPQTSAAGLGAVIALALVARLMLGRGKRSDP
jgi:membrane protein YdbS with pleckstrin-like domain